MSIHKEPRDSRKYKKRRLAVLNAAGWQCYYCGNEASQADHVIPIAEGGDPMSLSNLVAACKTCNLRKGKKSQGLFLATLDTPPVFSTSLAPKTAVKVVRGPCMGQPAQELN